MTQDGRSVCISAGTRRTSHFWSAGDGVACEISERFGEFHGQEEPPPPLPLHLSGLAVTEDHYLVLGVLEPSGLLIFDLHAGGAPRQILWPSEVPFAPFDMAPRPGGGVWILDRAHRCYWALDRNLNVINPEHEEAVLATAQADDFQPVDGSGPRGTAQRTFPRSFPLYVASPLTANDPVAIEALPDGTVLILDNTALTPDFSDVYRYRFSQQLGDPVSTRVVLDIVEEDTRAGFRLVGYDFAFVPEFTGPEGAVPDRLYIVAADGNQTFAFTLTQDGGQLTLQPVPAYFPMRLFGGKGLVATDTEVYYDFADGWILLVEQHRPRYVADATFLTPRFDGNEPNCVWHRLMLDACIPPETQVRVWSRAANDEQDLELTAWQAEPLPYLRSDGSELPFVRRRSAADGQKSKKAPDGDGTWELLFQRARGRFLQLQLHVSSNERTTPRLRALRTYYPRFSYLTQYLPALYREDEQSASFLDRFLANLEGVSTALEDKIAAVQMLFDVRSAPPDVLDWLASWFGVALDPAWDEVRRRLFIAHAMEFFQYRGTIRGLLMALRLVLEACPDETIFADPFRLRSRAGAVRIVEKYRTRRTPGVVFGDPTDLGGLRLVTPTDRWQPAQGREALRQRYTTFLQAAGVPSREDGLFPLSPQPQRRRRVRGDNLRGRCSGLCPPRLSPISSGGRNSWRGATDALAPSMRSTERVGPRSRVLPLPAQLPPDGVPLRDWYQFEGVVLAMHQTAHRFTVLLPTPQTDDAGTAEHQHRLALAQRIVSLEKPAHTIFEVKFYWSAFRVGEARLGEDTIVDLGSRAPQFLRAMVLGQGYLSESYLTPGHPYDVGDRRVVGRERLRRSAPSQQENTA